MMREEEAKLKARSMKRRNRRRRRDQTNHVGEDDLIKYLPNDILTIITLKLPRESLRRLSAVSKEWHRRVSSRSFIRQYAAVHPPMSGFYLQCMNGSIYAHVPAARPSAASPPLADVAEIENSVMMLGGDVDYEPPWWSHNAVVGASAGFLLLSTTTIKWMGGSWESDLVIYSPSRQQGFSIPLPPPQRPFYMNRYLGFTCDVDDDPPAQRFRLFQLRWTLDAVDVFDFDQWRWEERPFDVVNATSHSLSFRMYPDILYVRGVVANGRGASTYYWLCSNSHMISYDYSKSHLWLIRLPEETSIYDKTCCRLMSSAERIFFSLLGKFNLRIWMLNKDDGTSWSLYQNVGFLQLFVQQGPNRGRAGADVDVNGELIACIRRAFKKLSPFHPYLLGLDPEEPCRLFFWAQDAIISVDLRSKKVKKLYSDIRRETYQMLPIYCH